MRHACRNDHDPRRLYDLCGVAGSESGDAVLDDEDLHVRMSVQAYALAWRHVDQDHRDPFGPDVLTLQGPRAVLVLELVPAENAKAGRGAHGRHFRRVDV